MVENDTTEIPTATPAAAEESAPPAPPARRRRAASRPAGPPAETAEPADAPVAEATGDTAPEPAVGQPSGRTRAPRKTAAKRASKKAVAPIELQPLAEEAAAELPPTVAEVEAPAATPAPDALTAPADDQPAPRARRTRKATAKKAAPSAELAPEVSAAAQTTLEEPAAELRPEPVVQLPAATDQPASDQPATDEPVGAPEPVVPPVLFQAPAEVVEEPARPRRRRRAADATPDADAAGTAPVDSVVEETAAVDAPAEGGPRTRAGRRRRATRGQGSAEIEVTLDPAAEQAVAAAELLLDAVVADETEVSDDTEDAADAELPDEATGVSGDEDEDEQPDAGRRRRRRGGRGRRSRGRNEGESDESTDDNGDRAPAGTAAAVVAPEAPEIPETTDDTAEGEGDSDEEGAGGSRRRRRRRRRGGADDSETTTVEETERSTGRTRESRRSRTRDDGDEVQSLRGSTRLEAKKQRRREGRELGRRRTPLLTEAEFLARREAVERTMVVRQRGKRTQIAVLEDGMLVEHYIDNGDSGSLVGNVFLGRVQNVLPSMEAAFLDLGKGRNAVLYAGEVNWDAVGMEGQPKRIELALKSGDPVLVQVTKDPIGSKGARLTSQISLPGRFLVYVPGGSMTGISRKLPENERTRLKSILRRVVPEDAGVIVRTAAEGASEEDIAADVERLQEQWEQIQKASATASAPALLHGEPDLTVRVLRDVFNEDFRKVVVSGDAAWSTVEPYLRSVAPELADRVEKWTGTGDAFAAHRIDEQLVKALDRKVFLPSGGSLVIDRTEAMVVVDVNTGRFTGKGGGNLEETVTKNNLEAAEEIVRQLRLRDMGGIIVIDFIDMVLESNRDLVMRRLLECLGRDRTKHQVAEVTSLGLVQMTRKRVGTGLLEAFSEPCEHCKGRGVIVHLDGGPESSHSHEPEPRRRPLVVAGAPPSPALLAPPAQPPAAAPADVAAASADVADAAAPVADIAADPVAAEDPVSEVQPAEVQPAEVQPAEVQPAEPAVEAALLPGPDPVAEVVDEGRPQRRRRRATRP